MSQSPYHLQQQASKQGDRTWISCQVERFFFFPPHRNEKDQRRTPTPITCRQRRVTSITSERPHALESVTPSHSSSQQHLLRGGKKKMFPKSTANFEDAEIQWSINKKHHSINVVPTAGLHLAQTAGTKLSDEIERIKIQQVVLEKLHKVLVGNNSGGRPVGNNSGSIEGSSSSSSSSSSSEHEIDRVLLCIDPHYNLKKCAKNLSNRKRLLRTYLNPNSEESVALMTTITKCGENTVRYMQGELKQARRYFPVFDFEQDNMKKLDTRLVFSANSDTRHWHILPVLPSFEETCRVAPTHTTSQRSTEGRRLSGTSRKPRFTFHSNRHVAPPPPPPPFETNQTPKRGISAGDTTQRLMAALLIGPFYLEFNEASLVIPRKCGRRAANELLSPSNHSWSIVIDIGTIGAWEIADKVASVVTEFNSTQVFGNGPLIRESVHFVEAILHRLGSTRFDRLNISNPLTLIQQSGPFGRECEEDPLCPFMKDIKNCLGDLCVRLRKNVYSDLMLLGLPPQPFLTSIDNDPQLAILNEDFYASIHRKRRQRVRQMPPSETQNKGASDLRASLIQSVLESDERLRTRNNLRNFM